MTRQRLLPLALLSTLVALGTLMATLPTSGEHGNADHASPNMLHLASRAKTGSINTDLAFWKGPPVHGPSKDLAFAGSYDGFRIFDISDPTNPLLLSDFPCHGPQGDLSVQQTHHRLLLILSLDRPQTSAECQSSQDTPMTLGTDPISGTQEEFFLPGFEGLRLFDVTEPTAPVQIASVPTACGSHTHTTIPDQKRQRLIVYVSSYPIGADATPADADFGGPRCTIPHGKISIVEVPFEAPEAAHVLKEQPLHEDSLPFQGTLAEGGTGTVGCHDIAVYLDHSSKREVAAAACRGEGQLWDISDPANPDTLGPGHSHIRNPFVTRSDPIRSGLFHSAAFTWDGEVILFGDEWQGGGSHGCDGPEDDRGNIWFYQAAAPGTEWVPVLGRYMLPRPQHPEQVCSLHYYNVLPLKERYIGVAAAYEGGTTVFDFSGVRELAGLNIENLPGPGLEPTPADKQPVPLAGKEIAFFDAQGVDGRGGDSTWSAYWHNDYIWVNGERGLDVYILLDEKGKQLRARQLQHLNPQTQQVFQPHGQCGQRSIGKVWERWLAKALTLSPKRAMAATAAVASPAWQGRPCWWGKGLPLIH